MKKTLMLLLLALLLFNPAPAQAQSSVIVFAGDSITMGAWTTDGNGNQLTGLTTAQKFSTLIGQAKGFSTILNKGKDADTVAGLQARLQADVISQNPSTVVIMIGRNDVGNSATPITPVTTYKTKLGEIVQALKDAGIHRIIILSWPVMNHGFYAGINSPVYLDAMAQVAAEKGVYFIDVYSMWASYKWAASATVAEYDALYWDNIHPSAAGSQVIADFVLKPQFNYMFTTDATPTPTFAPTNTATPTETQVAGAQCVDVDAVINTIVEHQRQELRSLFP